MCVAVSREIGPTDVAALDPCGIAAAAAAGGITQCVTAAAMLLLSCLEVLPADLVLAGHLHGTQHAVSYISCLLLDVYLYT